MLVKRNTEILKVPLKDSFKKTRIMHIVQCPGGVENYISMLLKYMDRDSYEQILICSQDYKKENFTDLVDVFETVEMGREISFQKDIVAIYKIRKLIKKYQPQIVYMHSSKAGGVGRIANLFIKNKVIYNPHGWAFNIIGSQIKKFIYINIEKGLSAVTDSIVTVSKFEKEIAVHNSICAESKLKVIYNGIDIQSFKNTKGSFTINRGDLKIPKDAYVIGIVGRISRGKSVDTFLESAKLIKEQIPLAFFIIVGDGEDREEIESLIIKNELSESVFITGWVTNPLEYIRLFDQAMLLSKWEAFGLVLAEYMISSKPIIATNVGGIPELITNDENGILVSVDNVKKIVEASVKIYKNNAFKEMIVGKSLLKVEKKFDAKRVAEENSELICRLLAM